jgi:hypothetical protein
MSGAADGTGTVRAATSVPVIPDVVVPDALAALVWDSLANGTKISKHIAARRHVTLACPRRSGVLRFLISYHPGFVFGERGKIRAGARQIKSNARALDQHSCIRGASRFQETAERITVRSICLRIAATCLVGP